ncbi:hypothetical protein LOK49_LG13G02573 [Camellia lanceoleosa]|uniref:Uncharacterized protein n=1 Tax=Camellia lanceoleosa TaxID=1840588 RepID=A0ACC0FIN8_9ERIC|nr:hypothetical protein LOK49_LG13G02573 [Camellia lanceoleosa]
MKISQLSCVCLYATKVTVVPCCGVEHLSEKQDMVFVNEQGSWRRIARRGRGEEGITMARLGWRGMTRVKVTMVVLISEEMGWKRVRGSDWLCREIRVVGEGQTKVV